MGRYLVPATMAAAIFALATASLTVAAIPDHPGWWSAAIQIAVLGGIVPIIYAVNIRIVPVFSRRNWRSMQLLRIQVTGAIGGAWLTYAGRLGDERVAIIAGEALALAAAVLFTVNIVRLFRQPVGAIPPLPLPFPDQARVDCIAIQFTRLSGIYLLVGLAVGLSTEIWRPASGRWDLVWAHAMLVGFFLSMASGVGYHVLARWTTRRWWSVRAIRVHFWLVAGGLPVMLLALATENGDLFSVAGPFQAAALVLFVLNTLPLVMGLPLLSRFAWIGAATCLTVGVGLGASFAIDPVLGVRLRMAHAEINLFGWTGLLISAVAYYLVPRFAGSPLRWPRLAPLQVGILATSVVIGALALGARGYGRDVDSVIVAAQIALAASFFMLGAMVAGTFVSRPGTAVTMIAPRRPGNRKSLPIVLV